MGTDWKEVIPPVTTERENTLRVMRQSALMGIENYERLAEMTNPP
jgi:hypothetical protein